MRMLDTPENLMKAWCGAWFVFSFVLGLLAGFRLGEGKKREDIAIPKKFTDGHYQKHNHRS